MGRRAVSADRDIVFAIAVADLNKDGMLDIVLRNDSTPSITLINRSDGRDFISRRIGDGEGAVYGPAIADVTGDGCPDIVAALSQARSILYVNSCGK